MDSKSTFLNVIKKPIIGEIIGFFSIFLTLGAVAGTMDYFGLRGDEKYRLFQSFLGLGALYVVVSLFYRIWNFYKRLQ